jgi:hypothetical protein
MRAGTLGSTVAAGVLAVLGLAISGCSGQSSEPAATTSATTAGSPGASGATSTAAASSTTTTARPSVEPGTIPGTGLFEVGGDVPPGTYVSETAADKTCYAARLAKRDSPDPLIANYVVKGRSTVTIEKTDVYFETRDCATWKKR